MIAAFKGIFCEPASAASLAGALKLNRKECAFLRHRIPAWQKLGEA